MFGDKKRLFLLIGLVGVLVVVYLLVHGLPGSSSRESASTVVEGGDSDDLPASPGTRGKSAPERSAVEIRRNDVIEIAVRNDPENLPQLKKAAADSDWRVRHVAVDGVGRLGQKGDPKFLIGVLRNANENPDVRAAAAERLGEMRFWDAGPALLDAMEDSSEILRARAGVALRQIIIVDMGYRANDSPDRRSEVVQKIRNLWPWFYERFTKLEKASG